MSTKDIAYKFTFENIITTDTKYPIIWTPSGVSRMLNNPVYYGCSVYGKTTNKNGKRGVKTDIEEQIIVEDTHEGIVDKEMWDKVQQIKLNRNSKPLVLKLGKRKFSGLISCGLCGRIQSFHTSRYKRKRITSCQTRHYNDNRKVYTMCENKGANIEDFEVLFYDSLKIYIDDLKNDIDLIKSTETKNVKNNESEISHIEKQIKRIDLDIKRVQQGYKVEIFTQDEAHSEIKNLKIQKDSLENRLIKLQEHDDNSNLSYVESVLNKLKRVYSGKDDLPEQEINDILREYIHSIIYKKTDEDNGEIKLRIIWKEIVSEG
jgi:hypothetical protein